VGILERVDETRNLFGHVVLVLEGDLQAVLAGGIAKIVVGSDRVFTSILRHHLINNQRRDAVSISDLPVALSVHNNVLATVSPVDMG